MTPPLFPHQTAGAQWLNTDSKLLLADEPGLGKTRTGLAALKPTEHALVLCPAIGRGHWMNEAAIMDRRITVASYDQLVRQPDALPTPRTLILDEAHHLRNFTSQRAKLVLAKDGLARRAQRVIALTGTPYVKHAGDAACLSLALWPELVRSAGITSLAAWRERFLLTARRNVRGHWVDQVVGQQHEDQLNALLAPVMLRRTLASTGLELPAIWWQTVPLDTADHLLTEDARAMHELEDTLETAADLPPNEGAVARVRHELGVWKAPRCAEYIADQYEQTPQPLVVFYHHRAVGDRLFAHLLGTAPLARIDGETTDKRRNQIIADFQAGKVGFLLAQTQSCKEMITLTAARKCYFVEPDWTGIVNLQAAKRFARIGQTASTVIAQFLCIGQSLDEAIIRHQRREIERVSKLAC